MARWRKSPPDLKGAVVLICQFIDTCLRSLWCRLRVFLVSARCVSRFRHFAIFLRPSWTDLFIFGVPSSPSFLLFVRPVRRQRRAAMPAVCAAVGCSNSSRRDSPFHVHAFPADPRIAKLWVSAMQRDNLACLHIGFFVTHRFCFCLFMIGATSWQHIHSSSVAMHAYTFSTRTPVQ